jgi:hypothetical protein
LVLNTATLISRACRQNTGLVNVVRSGFLGPHTMSFLGVNAFSAGRSRGELTAPQS